MSINLTTIFQVMPYAQNVAHAELVAPQTQQVVSTMLAQEALKHEQSQVQKVEKQEHPETVAEERQARGDAWEQQQRKREKEPEPEEAPLSNASPWSGNLVNKRV